MTFAACASSSLSRPGPSRRPTSTAWRRWTTSARSCRRASSRPTRRPSGRPTWPRPAPWPTPSAAGRDDLIERASAARDALRGEMGSLGVGRTALAGYRPQPLGSSLYLDRSR